MDHYLLTARSITHAQQMARSLGRSGIYVTIRRASGAMTQNGCGYTVQIAARQFRRAAAALREDGVLPVRVFLVSGGARREVSL